MYPENAMGLSPQGSARMMNSAGEATASALPPSEVPSTPPVQDTLKDVAMQFQGAWKQLELLNGKFGGDSDKFRILLKAAEDWFSTIAQNLPESPQASY